MERNQGLRLIAALTAYAVYTIATPVFAAELTLGFSNRGDQNGNFHHVAYVGGSPPGRSLVVGSHEELSPVVFHGTVLSCEECYRSALEQHRKELSRLGDVLDVTEQAVVDMLKDLDEHGYQSGQPSFNSIRDNKSHSAAFQSINATTGNYGIPRLLSLGGDRALMDELVLEGRHVFEHMPKIDWAAAYSIDERVSDQLLTIQGTRSSSLASPGYGIGEVFSATRDLLFEDVSVDVAVRVRTGDRVAEFQETHDPEQYYDTLIGPEKKNKEN